MHSEVVWVLVASLARLAVGMIVHEVKAGEVAILPCPSNDNKHRFQYWQLENEQMLGPGNEINKHKYKYDVWSGQLYIKSVSTTESGFYKCISKQVVGQGLSIESVELIVKKDWEESWEEDSQTNAYRAVIGVLVFLILVLLGGFAFLVKRRRTQNFVDLTREESPDDSIQKGQSGTYTAPRSPHSHRDTYNPTTLPLPSTSRGRLGNALDNAVIETDLRSSFSLPDFD